MGTVSLILKSSADDKQKKVSEEQKNTRRLNGTAFRELTKSLVYNILVLATVLFLLQVVLLAIREDWTRLDLLYMGLESQNCHLSPVERGRESMGEDILSPSCGDDDDLFCGKFFKDKKE
ncbi:unnamed protein product, partial [Brassica napus]